MKKPTKFRLHCPSSLRQFSICLVLTFNLLFASSISSAEPPANDYELIMERVRAAAFNDNKYKPNSSPASTLAHLASYQADGSFSDIKYGDTSRTPWDPIKHLDRLCNFIFAYTLPLEGNEYFESEELYEKIVAAFEYWYSSNPRSSNWWQNQVASPQRIGIAFIQMRTGKKQLSKELEEKVLKRVAANGGDPASQTGVNKLDVALHWLFRGCLLESQTIVKKAVDQGFYPLRLTTGEGIKPDYNYHQHSNQIHIGGYGDSFVKGMQQQANYLLGTDFALSGAKLKILSKFVRETYANTIRGKYMQYNVNGRGLAQKGSISRSTPANYIEQYINFDTEHADEYRDIVKRMREQVPASYNVKPFSKYYYNSDYALHSRPEYNIGVRAVSTRTIRMENGDGSNLKGYFISEGSMDLRVHGDEYNNIFAMWNWAKIPGVTCPQFVTIPATGNGQWQAGNTTVSGGATDSEDRYIASIYLFNNQEKNINTSATKSWFFFDDEIVCLGAGVKSTAAFNVNTTLNQTLLKGDVLVSNNETESVLEKGTHDYTNTLNWALHNNMGYVFPKGGKVTLSNKEQSGDWKSINSTMKSEISTGDVFSLWFDHGMKPTNDSYAYIIVPSKNSAEEMNAYVASNNIEILMNQADVQAVKHKALDMIHITFSKAGVFLHEGMSIRADYPCAIILKNVSTNSIEAHVADVQQRKATLKLRIDIPKISEETKELKCDFIGTAEYAGKTKVYVIDENTPNYVPPLPIPDPDRLYSSIALADTYIRNGMIGADDYKKTNYGTEALLAVKKDVVNYHREAYLKFSLDNLDKIDFWKEDVKVIIPVYVTLSGTTSDLTNWNMYGVADITWSETEMTWENRVAVNSASTISQVQGVASLSKLAEYDPDPKRIVKFDITNYALSEYNKGNRVISVNIVNDKDKAALGGATTYNFELASKESVDERMQPKLQLYVYDRDESLPYETGVIDDAHVRGGTNTNLNYGGGIELEIKEDKGGNSHRETYLKFSIAALKNINLEEKDITATMPLYISFAKVGSTKVGWALKGVSSNNWLESTIKWNNRPTELTSEIALVEGRASKGVRNGEFNEENVVEFDLSVYVLDELKKGSQMISLNLATKGVDPVGGHDAYFASKENTDPLKHPKLVLTVADKPVIHTISLPSISGVILTPVPGEYKVVSGNRFEFSIEVGTEFGNSAPIVSLLPSGTILYPVYPEEIETFESDNVYNYVIENVSDNMEIKIEKDVVSGIDAGDETFAISLYPNPVEEVLYIKTNSDIGNINILIYNSLGKVLIEQTGKNTVDTSKLPSGVYMVKIKTKDAFITKKIIKK